MYLATDRELRGFCDAARAAGRLALDVEFIRERSYYPKIALVQLGVGGDVALVDPLGAVDLAPLDALLADAAVTKVLHSGSQDLEIFWLRTRRSPANVFDTQVAAALVGLGTQVAYGALVYRVLGVTLPKGEGFTDWLARPLSAEQERYALEDVRHLCPLHDALGERLRALGRERWVAEECRHFEDPEFWVEEPRTLYRRVRRNGVLSPRGLAVLRELAIWREKEAEERDRPRRSIVADEVLVELARMAPARQEDLRRFRGLHPQALARSADRILAAIQRGLALPEAECPHGDSVPRLDASALLAVDFLDSCLRALAERAEIAPSTIGTRAELEELVREHRAGTLDEEAIPIFHGWRRALIGNDMLAVLRGETSMYLDPETGAPRFEPRRSRG